MTETTQPTTDDAPAMATGRRADAARAVGFVAFGFVVLGLIFSFLLPETRPNIVDEPVAMGAAADVP